MNETPTQICLNSKCPDYRTTFATNCILHFDLDKCDKYKTPDCDEKILEKETPESKPLSHKERMDIEIMIWEVMANRSNENKVWLEMGVSMLKRSANRVFNDVPETMGGL